MPVTVVRLFNTVGPRQTGHYGMVVPSLVQQAMTGKPMTVYGDGSQSRCFGFVKDVVKALVALMERPEAVGEIYNIGASTEITILDLAKRVKEITQSASPIVLIPYDDAYETGYQDMPRRIPDTSKLRKLVGFAPTTGIDEIVDSVMKSFLARQERSAQRPQISLRHPVRVA
jgi:UDP-glucose 4-epimerase